MRTRRSALLATSLAGLLAATAAAPVGAQAPITRAPDIGHLAIEEGTDVGPGARVMADGRVDVVVRLTGPSVAEAAGRNATKGGGKLTAAGQRTRASQIRKEQNAIKRVVRQLGGRELGRVSRSLNAVIVRIGAGRLDDLAAVKGVTSVRPLRDYEMDLTETVPYIGARSGAFAPPSGADGSGIRVAVLDSGIDYTHANLGGAGTLEAYADAYGAAPGDPLQTTRDGFFPTAKVVDGYDFVGEAWPNSLEAPDPDPIDYEGHGTHVGDIIAGTGGVAPGASLLAAKVCSAVATSCSGLALLQAMDFALDPNGDGAITDAVDVVNMSLGSSFGQQEDDLSSASQNAVDAGVTVVASAGNSADRPYIAGSPSTTPGVISVAQSQVPSAVAYPLVVTGITPSTITNTATLDWAPVGSGFSGAVVRLGTACPGAGYFNGNSPAGKVALIDRGTCNVSLKVDRATKDGAVAVLIANNAAGDPPSFSFGGGDLPMVPSLVITLADGNRIKTALGATGVNPAVVATVSPAVSIPLAGSMVASSSRGPSMSFDAIKPDIAAPGASVSAVVGTGTGTQAFGGTSGAAPMVSGAAALLLSLNPSQDPLAVKARLMGTADTDIQTNPATKPGVLAPVTRIGGGEVRVDAAAATTTIAWDSTSGGVAQPSLSYGFLAVDAPISLTRRLTIRNLGASSRTYTLTPTYRYADDEASGGVVATVPGNGTVTIGAGRNKTVNVQLSIDPAKLPTWPFTFAPSQMGNGSLLNGPEYDGYIEISGGGDAVHVPWHVLPRASAKVAASPSSVDLASGSTLTLSNAGAIAGDYSVFALTGTSGRIAPGQQPGAGDNLAVIDLRSAGVRAFKIGSTMYGQFAVTTWDERSHPAYPAGFEIDIDTDLDGNPDWYVFNQENGNFATTGQTLVYIQKAGTTSATAYFYLDADFNSPNRVFTVPLSVMGISATTQFDFTVLAYDNYFSGLVTDVIGPMRYTGGTPRHLLDGDLGDGNVAAGTSVTGTVSAVAGGATASPSQIGFLVMNYSGAKGAESIAIRVSP